MFKVYWTIYNVAIFGVIEGDKTGSTHSPPPHPPLQN